MGSQRRITFIILGILAAYGYLVYSLYNLQIQKGPYYINRAEARYRLAGFLEPYRGIIYFTNKNGDLVPAAVNKSYPVVFAVPQEIEDASEAAHTIAPILELEVDKVQSALSNKKSLYRLLRKKASPEQVKKIKELSLKGIYVDEQEFRYYPFGSLAAHILGFVGPTQEDDQVAGRYGVEKQFNSLLAGKPGQVLGDKITRPIQGKDLALTIDRNIQGQAEEVLKNLVNKYNAEGGTIIVQETATGNILALANYPSFDPNNYAQSKLAYFLNPAVQSVYEPGSILKVITMASALDAGVVTPKTTYIDKGYLILNGRVIRNWDHKAYGKTTMSGIIEHSLNVGAAFVGRQLGASKLYDYLTRFGFKDKTGIQLPGEIVGDISNLLKPEEINLATASFGQGVSVTPIALINAISAIANDGWLMKPNILAGQKPVKVRQVISKKAADEITNMMVSAVKKAKIASIPGWKIAAKTGTAQVPDLKRGGYTDQVINTYIGFAPASKPVFTAMVKLDKPTGAPLAGRTVVPAFRELAEFILNYYNIPPDDLTAK